MGNLIYLEQIKIERGEKIRSKVLQHFPWQEIKSLHRYLINPLVHGWAEQQQIIVKEAIFRLVYEAFILGVQDREISSSKQWEEIREDQRIHELVQQIMDSFAMFRVFAYRKRTSLRMLFTSIAEEWYLRGTRSTLVGK